MTGKQKCYICKNKEKRLYEWRNHKVCNSCIVQKLKDENEKIITEAHDHFDRTVNTSVRSEILEREREQRADAAKKRAAAKAKKKVSA